jgi:O-acetyl-ADP-ribose deacetylase (regulator of RNase III)
MIRFLRGNLFESGAPALVNTVNCVGIMGKGIAYQFKRAFPAYFADYEKRCRREEVRLGEVYAFREGEQTLISFPTKKHWRSGSKLEDIDAGLVALRALLLAEGIKRVAVPPLGCGNGGLAWTDVRPLIERHLGDLPGEVLVYEPAGAFEARVAEEPKVSLGHFVLAAIRVGLEHPNKLAIQKAAYLFNVFAGVEYFKFSEYKYGPYCAAIDPMFNVIRDYLDFTQLTPAAMVNDGIQRRLPGVEGERLLRWQPAIAQATELCNRHPRDIEALATAHAVLANDGPLSLELATQRFLTWSKEKAARFGPEDVARAIDTLITEGLAERTLLGFAARRPGASAEARPARPLTVPDELAVALRRHAERVGCTVEVALQGAIEAFLAGRGQPA